MVTRLSHDVFCDHCGDWEHAFVDSNVNRHLARKEVEKKGWGRRYGQDFCPDCWEEFNEDREEFRRRVSNLTDEGPAPGEQGAQGEHPTDGPDGGQAGGDSVEGS